MAAYIQFDIGGQPYAVPVGAVVEVLHLVAVTPVPEQPADHLGVITLRGHVIPVIDLRQRFQGQATPLHINTPMLVLQHGEGQVAVIADGVHDVITLEQHPEPAPEPGVDGIFRHGDETVIIPNIPMIFAPSV